MTKAAVLAFLVLGLATLVLPAQAAARPAPVAPASLGAGDPEDPQPPPPPVIIVVNFLGLSQDQAAQFGHLLESLQTNVHGLELQMQAAQKQLGELLDASAPDPAAVGRLLLQIRGLQQQVQQAVESFRQQFLQLLTADQKDKLGAVQQAAQLLPAVSAFGALHLIELPSPPGPQ